MKYLRKLAKVSFHYGCVHLWIQIHSYYCLNYFDGLLKGIGLSLIESRVRLEAPSGLIEIEDAPKDLAFKRISKVVRSVIAGGSAKPTPNIFV